MVLQDWLPREPSPTFGFPSRGQGAIVEQMAHRRGQRSDCDTASASDTWRREINSSSFTRPSHLSFLNRLLLKTGTKPGTSSCGFGVGEFPWSGKFRFQDQKLLIILFRVSSSHTSWEPVNRFSSVFDPPRSDVSGSAA